VIRYVHLERKEITDLDSLTEACKKEAKKDKGKS
jgi:hypothetical protein